LSPQESPPDQVLISLSSFRPFDRSQPIVISRRIPILFSSYVCIFPQCPQLDFRISSPLPRPMSMLGSPSIPRFLDFAKSPSIRSDSCFNPVSVLLSHPRSSLSLHSFRHPQCYTVVSMYSRFRPPLFLNRSPYFSPRFDPRQRCQSSLSLSHPPSLGHPVVVD